MRPSPCKDCTDRHAECHSRCERYSVWKAEYDKVRDVINKNKRQEQIYQQHRVEYAFKCKKKRGGMK